MLCVDAEHDRAQETVNQIKAENGVAEAFAADVTRAADCKAMVEQASKKWGGLDILHNNVGVGAGGTPETVSLADWNHVLDTNLTTAMLCSKYCLPKMKAGGGGSVIMVSSIAGALGLMGSPGAIAYATAKAGLHGFTLSLAADYATQNIRANCIIVGSVHTPMVAHLGAEVSSFTPALHVVVAALGEGGRHGPYKAYEWNKMKTPTRILVGGPEVTSAFVLMGLALARRAMRDGSRPA